jgi:hypothetical protein
MSKAKIESVLNFPRPKDKTCLRALLGLANYFCGFVPEHSTIVAPLNRMVDQRVVNGLRCPGPMSPSKHFRIFASPYPDAPSCTSSTTPPPSASTPMPLPTVSGRAFSDCQRRLEADCVCQQVSDGCPI